MFFVFGPSGQMYRGGVENLSRVAPVRRVPRTQAPAVSAVLTTFQPAGAVLKS